MIKKGNLYKVCGEYMFVQPGSKLKTSCEVATSEPIQTAKDR